MPTFSMPQPNLSNRWTDVNFDGIVGPSHHFGGLGIGNLASRSHRGQPSRPRAAALQGLEKMRRSVSLGARQAVLPPQRRPVLGILRRLGFEAKDIATLLRLAASEEPQWLSAVWSASAMWTANAATVSPGCATADGKTHLTIANLCSSLHRSLEPAQTLRRFRAIFRDAAFVVHPPLPATFSLRDEGAANHMRFTDRTGSRGVDVFVYGSDGGDELSSLRFLPRQSLQASHATARLHGLDPASTFYLQQHPAAIDAGAFHNDVVATNHRNVWLHHADAYLDAQDTIASIERRFSEVTGETLLRHEVSLAEVSREDAVNSYLFNSQLISRDPASATMTLLCPEQVRETPSTNRMVQALLQQGGPIDGCEFVELRESMHNGGGPACLRLRVPMTDRQWKDLPEGGRWTERLAGELARTIEKYYPETLEIEQLVSPDMRRQCVRAVREIERVLGL
ncbi:MAG: N-succinylarginine dihydrolase [Planctomycetaceae bacterium]